MSTEDYVSCNGQMIYRQKCYGVVPDRRCEVFVGRVPRDCRLKEDLVPLFKSIGRLLEFRLLVSFSGHCRGYGFAIYATRKESIEAIRVFDNYEIKDNWFLGVCWTRNKCKIGLCNLPEQSSFREIATFIFTIADSCVSGESPLYVVYDAQSRNVIWEFKTHRAAALNRKNITGPAASSFGPQTQVTWIDPNFIIDPEKFSVMATRKDKSLNIDVSPTDFNLIHMFDTDLEERNTAPPTRKIKKEDTSNKSEVAYNSLMQRRNANIPHIRIADPGEKTIDLIVDWNNLPSSLTSLFLSSKEIEMPPKVYSPANSKISIDMNAKFKNNARFSFDQMNLSEGVDTSSQQHFMIPNTPTSSGYGSNEHSPPFYNNYRNDVTQSTILSGEDGNMFCPSYFDKKNNQSSLEASTFLVNSRFQRPGVDLVSQCSSTSSQAATTFPEPSTSTLPERYYDWSLFGSHLNFEMN